MNYGIQQQPNAERTLGINYNGKFFNRYPVKTPIINIGQDLIPIIKELVTPTFKPGDVIALSEKVVSIAQNNVVHQNQVKPSWLAKLICRFVTKYPNDVGFENPLKMQVAINQAGYLRMFLAVAIGGVMKFVFKVPGYFYVVAGKEVAAIDGFNPIAVKPFNEYAILSPSNPNEFCNQVEAQLGIPTVIVDASNLATHVLGKSSNFKYSDSTVAGMLYGNPMGQGDEQTPIILVRAE